MNSVTFLFLLLLSTLCLGQEMSNMELVKKSIAYHDPNNEWHVFQGDFMIETNKGKILLKLNNAKGIAIWTEKLKSGDSLTGGYLEKNSCLVQLNGEEITAKGELEGFLLDCKNIIDRTQYWIYMYGIPMKLMDNTVNFVGSPKLVKFLGETMWMIKVNYNLEQTQEYWQFYFSPENYALKATRFFHPALGKDSEYILYKAERSIGGLKLPTQHSWYMFDKKEFIGSENLVETKN
ncbi:MAG: DUF6503 family protein [Bacteroidota bacterium]